jgi:hypothetical protein
LWIKIFFKNQLNYELAKQEHTQLWKQWQRKKQIRQQNKFKKQECNLKVQKKDVMKLQKISEIIEWKITTQDTVKL